MKDKVYSQVYSILRTSREGLLDALTGLAEIGWDGVEAMGTNTGGLTRQDFHKFVDDLGLKIISFHSLRDDEDRAYAQSFGAKFSDVRPLDNLRTAEDCKRSADLINEQCRRLADFGMRGVVHNHAEEFRALTDDPTKTCYDMLMEYTDPELVSFELDVGWAQRANVNPAALIRKYSGRFPVLHVKECAKVAECDEELEHFPPKVMELASVEKADGKEGKYIKGAPKFSDEQMRLIIASRSWNVALGQGLIDWADVVKAAEAQPGGCQAYISEREYFGAFGEEVAPMEFAKRDYAFLRAL